MTTKNELKAETNRERAFILVSDPADWKAPIDAYVTGAELTPVYQAIEYFTATKPVVEYVGIKTEKMTSSAFARFAPGDHIVRVRAAGYRNGPAGDH